MADDISKYTQNPNNYVEDLSKVFNCGQTIGDVLFRLVKGTNCGYDLDYARELSKIALSLNKKAKIHIAMDTGMGRIGFLPNEKSIDDITEIYSLEGIDVVGIFTHFSTSDEKDKEYSHQQFTKMMSVIDELEKRGIDIPLKHVANSGAIIDLPSTYLDAVRAGIILYGYYPSDEVNKSNLALKPALTLKATITNVKTLEKDMYISYGRTFKTSDKTHLLY